MMARLLLLFIGLPVIELTLLLTLGRKIGVIPTVLIILVTGALGAYHARSQGFQVLARFQGAMAEGRLPHREIVEGLLVLLAGAFLLTPGFLTDTIGFLLLLPQLRARAAAYLEAKLRDHLHVTVAGASAGFTSGPPPGPTRPRSVTRKSRGPVIDAAWVDDDADDGGGAGPR